MKLNENDIQLFKDLNSSSSGKALLDYLERLKRDIFNPENLTKENLDSKKEVARIIDEDLINRVKLVNQERQQTPYQYE